jgi:hypothetical protein
LSTFLRFVPLAGLLDASSSSVSFFWTSLRREMGVGHRLTMSQTFSRLRPFWWLSIVAHSAATVCCLQLMRW